MVCRDCGKELDETNMVVGTSRETGEKVYFCEECFEKRSGISIAAYERRKLTMKIIPFVALLAVRLAGFVLVALSAPSLSAWCRQYRLRLLSQTA